MNIAYVAYTERNVLMLDDDGVCVRVEPLRTPTALRWGDTPHEWPELSDGALRCIGAQYVASIDPSAPGGLAHMPRVGTSMLFAAAAHDGRIYCVRAGPLTHFESCTADDSGVQHTPIGTERVLAEESDPILLQARRDTPAPFDDFEDETDDATIPFADKTDPGFSVSLHDELGHEIDPEDEPETAPYPSRYSHVGRVHARSTPVPPAPPPPLPRIQGTAVRQPSRHVPAQGGVRPTGQGMIPSQYVARARPPAPSSHAWLRASPAAERRFR